MCTASIWLIKGGVQAGGSKKMDISTAAMHLLALAKTCNGAYQLTVENTKSFRLFM